MIARLLRDKGVYEYVEAARIVKRLHPQTRFVLVGPFDPNPAAIKPPEVDGWVREGVIDYKGAVKDVRPLIAACHVYVLPSFYGEGIPRTVLEAMAMSRAIITTDEPGCRETVEGSSNGTLIEARSATHLAEALIGVISEGVHRVQRNGFASRRLAATRFDAVRIAEKLTSLIEGH